MCNCTLLLKTLKRTNAQAGHSMPLIVAPLPDYDALVSLAYADAYWASMGDASWALATVAAREAAIRRGTQYILGRQVLAVAVDPIVLRPVKDATCEASQRALRGTLYADVAAAGILEKTVGPITVRYSAAGNAGQLRIPIIDELLRGLTAVTFAGGTVYLERA